MPTDAVTREVMDIALIVDDKLARKGIIQVAKEFSKRNKIIEKSIERVGKISKKIETFSHKHNLLWLKSTREQISTLKVQAQTIGGLTDKLEKEKVALSGISLAAKRASIDLAKSEEALSELKDQLKEVAEQEKKAKADGKEFDASKRAALEEQIKGYEKIAKGSRKTVKQQDQLKKSIEETQESLQAARKEALGGEGMIALEAADKIKKEVEEARKELTSKFMSYRAGTDIGDAFKEVVSGIGSKDMKGMAGGLAKGLGSGLKGLGAKASRWGAKAQVDPAAGAMTKVMGKMAGSIGGMVGTLAKLGPILSMTAGIFVAIVKLLIDAEAAAKEFNKEVLATMSTTETLAANGGKANVAYYELRDTMDQIRDAAVDMKANLDWGISKKQHAEFLGALGSEGIAIERIKNEAAAAGKEVGQFSADAVHVAVGFSRIWGVSLSELSTFQGEIMRDMGASAKTVEESFYMMDRAANESGISANKFFSIIRSMSADMSLFNLRMEEAVGTLKMLGKVMSPRNAESFLKTITSFYKSMGLEDRIKATILGGGEKATGARLQKDVNVRIEGLARDVEAKLGGKGTADELKAALKSKDPTAITKFMAKHQGKIDGATREAILDAGRMQSKLTKGGLVNIASALKDASPTTAMDQLDAIAKNMFKKPVEDLSDVEMLAFTKLAGVSDEQIDQLAKSKASINQVREDLAYRLDNNLALSEEQKALATKLGIQGTGAEAAAKARAATGEAIWASMTQAQKDALGPAKTQLDFAKQQTDMLSTVSDKLEVIADYLLNLVYQGLMWVLDAMPGASQQRELARIQMNVMKSGNKELQDAFSKSGGDVGKFKGAAIMETDIGKKTAGILVNTGSEIQSLRDKQAELVKVMEDGSKSNEERAAAEAARGKIEQEIQAKQSAYADVTRTVNKNFGRFEDKSDKMVKAMIDSGVGFQEGDTERRLKAMDKLEGGADLSTALEQSGFSEDEIGKIMGKALWQLSPEQVASVLGQQAKSGAPTPAAAAAASTTPGPETPSAQSSATAASAAPGTGGGTTPAAAAPAGVSPASAATTSAALTAQTSKMGVSGPMQEHTNALMGVSQDQVTEAQKANATAEDMEDLMRKKGIVLNKTFMTEKLAPVLYDNVLKALRLALFEYWMYQDLDKKTVAAGLAGGQFTGEDFGKKYGEYAKSAGKDVDEDAFWKAQGVEKAQTGAIIKGVTPDGMAIVQRPPPGEGLMSGAPGEVVGRPGQMAAAARGGGGGSEVTVKLELSQDLRQVIRAEAGNVVVASRGRERFQG